MKQTIKKTLILAGATTVAGLAWTAFAMTEQAKSAAATAPAKALPARATKIAVVQPQAILQSSEEWQEKMSSLQQEFEKRAVNLGKEREELAKKARESGSAAAREAIKDMAKKQKDIEIDERSLQADFEQRHQEAQMAIAQKVESAIEASLKANGWDAAVPKFFYASPDIDITPLAVEEMNKEYRKEKAAKKFKKDAATTAPRAAAPTATSAVAAKS